MSEWAATVLIVSLGVILLWPQIVLGLVIIIAAIRGDLDKLNDCRCADGTRLVVVGSGLTAEGKIWLQVLEENPIETDPPEAADDV